MKYSAHDTHDGKLKVADLAAFIRGLPDEAIIAIRPAGGQRDSESWDLRAEWDQATHDGQQDAPRIVTTVDDKGLHIAQFFPAPLLADGIQPRCQVVVTTKGQRVQCELILGHSLLRNGLGHDCPGWTMRDRATDGIRRMSDNPQA